MWLDVPLRVDKDSNSYLVVHMQLVYWILDVSDLDAIDSLILAAVIYEFIRWMLASDNGILGILLLTPLH